MTSTSCSETAEELLARAISGESPAELPRALLEEPCHQALFSILAEGLADRFEPALCDVYAQLFSQAIAAVVDGADAAATLGELGHLHGVRTDVYAHGRRAEEHVLPPADQSGLLDRRQRPLLLRLVNHVHVVRSTPKHGAECPEAALRGRVAHGLYDEAR